MVLGPKLQLYIGPVCVLPPETPLAIDRLHRGIGVALHDAGEFEQTLHIEAVGA